VAHVGEELALGAAGRLGALLLGHELRVQLAQLGVLVLYDAPVLAEVERHLVHGVGELAELVSAQDREPGGELPGADPRGSVLDLAHDADETSGEHEARAERDEERDDRSAEKVPAGARERRSFARQRRSHPEAAAAHPHRLDRDGIPGGRRP
jgi:hypothetical protein